MLQSFGSVVFPGIVMNSKVCVFTSSKLVDCRIGTWLVKGWGGFWFVVCLSLLGGSHDPPLILKTHSSAARRHLLRVLPTPSLPSSSPLLPSVTHHLPETTIS